MRADGGGGGDGGRDDAAMCLQLVDIFVAASYLLHRRNHRTQRFDLQLNASAGRSVCLRNKSSPCCLVRLYFLHLLILLPSPPSPPPPPPPPPPAPSITLLYRIAGKRSTVSSPTCTHSALTSKLKLCNTFSCIATKHVLRFLPLGIPAKTSTCEHFFKTDFVLW